MITSSAHSDCTCELYRTLRSGEHQVFDIPKLFRRKPVEVREGRVFEIDPRAKLLRMRGETREDFKYDRLIVATGATRLRTDLVGLEDLLQHQNPLEPRIFHARSNKQVSELRYALRRLGWQNKSAKKDQFVVILGGGATGVEMAGEIAAMRERRSSGRVIIVEGRYEPLKPALGTLAHKLLREQMRKMGIEYFEGSSAKRVDAKHLHLENGQMIPWDLLVVAQGSSPDVKLFGEFGDMWTEQQQIKVARDFHIEDWSGHYALGDLAHYPWAKQELPRTAQVASQQGTYLADLFAAELLGEKAPSTGFRWQNWGYLVSLGPTHGAGKLGPLPLPVVWGPAVDVAKRGARWRFDAEVFSGLRL